MQPRSCLTSDYLYADDDDDVFNYFDYEDDVFENENGHEDGHNDGHAKLSWCQIYL